MSESGRHTPNIGHTPGGEANLASLICRSNRYVPASGSPAPRGMIVRRRAPANSAAAAAPTAATRNAAPAPGPSASTPAKADPPANPAAMPVVSHVNASVTVPSGAAESTSP